MKLCTFQIQDCAPAVGLVVGDRVIRITDHLSAVPGSMIELITAWADWREPLQQLAASGATGIALDQIMLLAPVPRPGKILGIGLNYADHVEESGMDLPADQLWFAKMNTSANGPFSPVDLPKVSETLDYEAEMVFIVGKRCRHLTPESAKEAIFGYCVGNDVSVRDCSCVRRKSPWASRSIPTRHSARGLSPPMTSTIRTSSALNASSMMRRGSTRTPVS
ncbi:hypothetical protein PS928_06329 [Pseudomonas fluorescens]|uniref:Fumarylacetoacetase-like C-terminal domain-containing protein n=1 Tax=Pseudomonas fluorescens TaxID=294 RepID=A0A5E7VT71_PSEFL|nr:fumarylacetoacetate hydrolase family protein [Pseudomonas fluorescens]VVQ26038.1 hypothetical protein PS928_06329 [Pseudomonas fluorescens]